MNVATVRTVIHVSECAKNYICDGKVEINWETVL